MSRAKGKTRKPDKDGRPVKAYENLTFLHSRDARTIRILCEYLEPLRRFRREGIKDTVVFFGSARAPAPEDKRVGKGRAMGRYYDDARELARRLTEWSKGLGGDHRKFIVCSGGGPGIMEAANRGAADAAGKSVGLTISLPYEVQGNRFITREVDFEFHYFFMRKFWFVYLAKAAVFFPGGFGTIDEIMEILTLRQTGKVNRPLPLVLYGSEYWKDILNFDKLVEWGSISPADVDLFEVCDTVGDAFDFLTRELLANEPKFQR